MGSAEDEFDEQVRAYDELVDFDTSIKKRFYVLREREEGRNERVRLNGLAEFLPLSELRRGILTNLTKETFFVNAEGSYFPDFIEENGIYLVSAGFLEYLQEKLSLGNIVYNTVGIVAEDGNRVEEYHLIIPDELDDAVLQESARYNKLGDLEFFEIDEEKVGYLEIFRVKGFPHLIVTEKLNRIQFAGFECVRIENFFDYEGERDRVYRERMSGSRLQDTIAAYERRARAESNSDYLYGFRRVLNNNSFIYDFRKELGDGLKTLFESHSGEKLDVDILTDRFLLFFWSDRSIEPATDHQVFFNIDEILIKSLAEATEFIQKLPLDLKTLAEKALFEFVLHYISQECQRFDAYPKVHNEERFRLYLHQSNLTTMIPPLIYDFKGSLQRNVEKAERMNGLNLSGQDLREFDFSGKSLAGLTIEDSDLRRAKFRGSQITRTSFINCNLTGCDFRTCNAREAKFINCYMDRVCFDGAEMQGVEFSGNYLNHSSFVKSDLTGAKFKLQTIQYLYFYCAKLMGTVFEVSETFVGNVFRLCDLKNSKFFGDVYLDEAIIKECDFRDSDLTSSRFEVCRIESTLFRKAKLNDADFSKCDVICGCDFRWSSCMEMNLLGILVIDSDFSWDDLSKMKMRYGVTLVDNNFTYANLEGYDFEGKGYLGSSILMYTNLTNCNLKKVDLRECKLKKACFSGAKLKEAKLIEKQLLTIELSTIQRSEIAIESLEGY